MASVDVVNAAFLVGSLAITTINRKLAEERTADAWYGKHVDVFTKKKIGGGRHLHATLVVGAHERREVVPVLLANSAAWLKRTSTATETCWLPLYEALKQGLQHHLEVPVSNAGQTVALLSQKPTASIDCWALVATTYAMAGRIRFDEDSGGRQLCTMVGPRFTLTAWRSAFTEPWQGHIEVGQGNSPFPTNGRPGWENLLSNGSTLLDLPMAQLRPLMYESARSAQEQEKIQAMRDDDDQVGTHLVSEAIFEQLLTLWLTELNKSIDNASPPDTHPPEMNLDLYHAWRRWFTAAITCREKVSSLSGRIGRVFDWALDSAVNKLNKEVNIALQDQWREHAFTEGLARSCIQHSLLCSAVAYGRVNQIYVIGTRFMAFGDSPSFNLAGCEATTCHSAQCTHIPS